MQDTQKPNGTPTGAGSFSESPKPNGAVSEKPYNPLFDKKYLVRVIEASRVNVHIYDAQLGRILHIRGGGDYKLLQMLVKYVKENGEKKEMLVYYPFKGKYYTDVWYQTELTAREIINLLDITMRNRHSETLRKVMDFVTTLWMEDEE